MNSDVWIHSIESEFMNLIHKHEFMTWITYWESRIIQYSEFMIWIQKCNLAYEFLYWIQKNHNSDYCYEFIYELELNVQKVAKTFLELGKKNYS